MVECREHSTDAGDLAVKIGAQSIQEPVRKRGLSGDERQAAATHLQFGEELLPGLRPGRFIRNHHRPTVGADLDSCCEVHFSLPARLRK
jgi:hypothetical protein